jgi:hypothetical protein
MIVAATTKSHRFFGACVVSIERKVNLLLAAIQLHTDKICFLPLEETLHAQKWSMAALRLLVC